ncbi:MAG: DUF2809 domain-containing protein [Verrucomicrobia bacterium]|jgi:hypothetical protein|nr:DUF2809 domain-containing protein [Verrucomicrobiota bacterium]
MPDLISTYAGDTLWALMVFMGLGFLLPRAGMFTLASVALVISFGVEFSQLYQSEWIEAVRTTRVGALALGAGFKASDLVCYTVGIAMGVAGEVVCRIGGFGQEER